MKKPNGSELLQMLLKLYAEQEGVRITYKLEDANEAA